MQRSNEQSDAEKFVKIVPVADVLFTHDSICAQFQDGKTFPALIQGLQSGEIVSLREGFLTLEAIEFDNKIFTMDNRRLYCLKEFQKGMSEKVMVKLKVTRFVSKELREFLTKLTTVTAGSGIRVRAAVGNGMRPNVDKSVGMLGMPMCLLRPAGLLTTSGAKAKPQAPGPMQKPKSSSSSSSGGPNALTEQKPKSSSSSGAGKLTTSGS